MNPAAFLKRQFSDLKDAAWYLKNRRSVAPFGLSACREGFRSRVKEVLPDKRLISRLIDAYSKAKADEAKASEPYRVRGEWQRIIEVEYARLLDVLKRKDAAALGELLSSFCRNECSRGLDMSAHFLMRKKRPLADFWYIRAFDRIRGGWKELGAGDLDPQRFSFPEIGDPVGLKVGGYLVPRSSIRHLYYASRIKDLLPSQNAVVAEIGGGFGGLAYYLLKESRGVHYADFDLPEIGVVIAYFLLSAFPEWKTALYGESAASLSEVVAAHDITVYPHFTFPQLAPRSVDLVFNSNSLTEMDEAAVREYYDQVARVCRGYFFHVNHDDELVYDKQLNKKHVKLSKYELPAGSFETVYAMRPFFLNKAYYEYLYKAR